MVTVLPEAQRTRTPKRRVMARNVVQFHRDAANAIRKVTACIHGRLSDGGDSHDRLDAIS